MIDTKRLDEIRAFGYGLVSQYVRDKCTDDAYLTQDEKLRIRAMNTIRELCDELERLRAEQEWQPIETAPKDGTPILVHSHEGWIGRVVWPKDNEDSCFQDEHGEFILPEWLTNWRYLPQPPATQQGEKS